MNAINPYHNTVILAITGIDDGTYRDFGELAEVYTLMSALGLVTSTEIPSDVRLDAYASIIEAVQSSANNSGVPLDMPWLENGLRTLKSLQSGAIVLENMPFHNSIVNFLKQLSTPGNPVFDVCYGAVGLRFASTLLRDLGTDLPNGQLLIIADAYELATVKIFGEDTCAPVWVINTQTYLRRQIDDTEGAKSLEASHVENDGQDELTGDGSPVTEPDKIVGTETDDDLNGANAADGSDSGSPAKVPDVAVIANATKTGGELPDGQATNDART